MFDESFRTTFPLVWVIHLGDDSLKSGLKRLIERFVHPSEIFVIYKLGSDVVKQHFRSIATPDWVGQFTNVAYWRVGSHPRKVLPNPTRLWCGNIVFHMVSYMGVDLLQVWIPKTLRSRMVIMRTWSWCSPLSPQTKTLGRRKIWRFITFSPNRVVWSMKSAYKRSYPSFFDVPKSSFESHQVAGCAHSIQTNVVSSSSLVLWVSVLIYSIGAFTPLNI